MFSLFDAPGQSALPHKSGTIEINTEYHTRKKPLWLVLLKVLGALAMIAVGAAIAVPTLVEFEYPLWQSIAITAGAMIVYTGIAFFFRPDPFQATEMNRFLWRLYCVLGPGRFTAETFLDVCALVGVARGEEVAQVEDVRPSVGAALRASPISSFDATQPIPPLDPNRFAQSSGNFVAGQIQLDSQRFFSTASSSLSEPAKA